MKEDKSIAIIFILLIGMLLLALMPRYSIDNAITGAAVSVPVDMTLGVAVIILVVAVIIAAIIFSSRKHSTPNFSSSQMLVEPPEITMSRPKLVIEKPKTTDDKLTNYVQAALDAGQSKSQIRNALLGVGWDKAVIEKVIKRL